jgi:hypothetical protein
MPGLPWLQEVFRGGLAKGRIYLISGTSGQAIDHRQLLSPGEKLGIDMTRPVLLAISESHTSAGLPNLTGNGPYQVRMTLEYKNGFEKWDAETKAMSIVIPVEEPNVQRVLFRVDQEWLPNNNCYC